MSVNAVYLSRTMEVLCLSAEGIPACWLQRDTGRDKPSVRARQGGIPGSGGKNGGRNSSAKSLG